MHGMKEVQTSKASRKIPFLKLDIRNNGEYTFLKRQQYEPSHEKLRARAQSTTMLQ